MFPQPTTTRIVYAAALLWFSLALGTLTAPPVTAQETPPTPPAGPETAPCSAAEHSQFDFWLGTWEVVERATGNLAGHNTIEKILGGCALSESWTGAGGSKGQSFNLWNARAGQWHQTWVDNQGGLLQLDGGLRDGAMVLEGKALGRDGTTQLIHRITWTPQPDGQVRQHWVVSKDAGETWSDLFDGLYRRAD